MYVTVRNYAGGREFADALVSHQDEIREILTGIEGFRAYYLVRTTDGATTMLTSGRPSTSFSTSW